MLSIPLMSLTIKRNKEWKDIEKFYLNELSHNGTVRMANNLGMYYADENDLEKALQYYSLASKGQNKPQPFHNMGRIYLRASEEKRKQNKIPEHIQLLNYGLESMYSALRIDPNFIYSLNELKNVYTYLKQPEFLKKTEILMKNVQSGKSNSQKDIESLKLEFNEGMYFLINNNLENALQYYLANAKKTQKPEDYYDLAQLYMFISEENREKGNSQLQTQYIDQCLEAHYSGLKVNPNFLPSLKDVYQIYQFYNVGKRTIKVKNLIDRVQQGDSLQLDDIVKSMEQEHSK